MLTKKVTIIPIYRYSIRIVVFDNFNEVTDTFPEVESRDCKGTVLDYGDRCMICVPPNDIPTIIHECEHVKNSIWKRIGFIPTPDNDEPDAYLLEYLYKEVMKVVRTHLATQC